MEGGGWWVATKWQVTTKLSNFLGEMAQKRPHCTQNVTKYS